MATISFTMSVFDFAALPFEHPIPQTLRFDTTIFKAHNDPSPFCHLGYLFMHFEVRDNSIVWTRLAAVCPVLNGLAYPVTVSPHAQNQAHGPNSLLKKGSDPLETPQKRDEFKGSERVRPLFQQAAKTSVWPQAKS